MDKVSNQSLLKGTCDASDDAIAVVNPATNEVIGYVPSLQPAQIEGLIEQSKQAQKLWHDRTASERSAILKRWYDLVIENSDDLARIMTLSKANQ